MNPAVKGYYVELPPPTLKEPLADFERLRHGPAKSYGLKDLGIDFSTLQLLPQRLRAGDWKVTAMVWLDREIIDLQPGKVEDFYGAPLTLERPPWPYISAICGMVEIASSGAMMNPQVGFGEDVMARITYCHDEPRGRLKANARGDH